jgi:hypothetical protein
VGFHNFAWMGRGRENLCNQGVRVQRDRRDDLIQLFRRLLPGLRHGLLHLVSTPGLRGRQDEGAGYNEHETLFQPVHDYRSCGTVAD